MVVLTDITNLIEKENVAQELAKAQQENAVMSHELKTPLEIIVQEANGLCDSLKEKDKENHRSANAISIASVFVSNFVQNMI
mmetsp:Transcript_38634/g.27969  ORF Transcript_38634/g.27969 Transcript_38634/m.27969 type:complete len:82 (+) Transcript_38634:1221-1466(+)|eukprot:CAMPEP_0116872576 /NCGR_PEP_ID=MMETSP0463-20121206/3359_1 /TAXON_ID=181622 /ORGANISM="Strombidinopsis sp, Strain SopsisLIS2011" /LENGTH=81 /DNA_ID=CAMNT_0004513001 /DNA_START=1107 /DNA_END=1352 /DNA_ORIENTATION=+